METIIFTIFWTIYPIIRAIKHTKIHPLLNDKPQKKWKSWVFIDRLIVLAFSLIPMAYYSCCPIEVLWLVPPVIFMYALIFNSTIGWINKRDITYIGNRYPDNKILATFQNKYMYYFFLLCGFSWMFNMISQYDSSFIQIKGLYVFLFNLVTGLVLLGLYKLNKQEQ